MSGSFPTISFVLVRIPLRLTPTRGRTAFLVFVLGDRYLDSHLFQVEVSWLTECYCKFAFLLPFKVAAYSFILSSIPCSAILAKSGLTMPP